ncbi:hypothetical protein HaLaN_09761, partial [Haematococcus lacustris]
MSMQKAGAVMKDQSAVGEGRNRGAGRGVRQCYSILPCPELLPRHLSIACHERFICKMLEGCGVGQEVQQPVP